ncbi:YncE family protein [Streptomyces polygonati]|uniref:YncE family protein n=1 Tax=Streptomyces polygonati TaxID=1617087 RepID=A0ABV8HGT8_9ACTN
MAVAVAVTAGTAFAALPVSPAAADSGQSIPQVLVDNLNHRVYVDVGNHLSYVEVFDLDGNRVGTIDNLYRSTGMALSPDGGTLYIAQSAGGYIAAVSTTTLETTAAYDLGGGAIPEHLAFAGGRLWFGYRAFEGNGIGSLDVGASTPTVNRQPQAPWDDTAPNVLADPADPNKLIVGSDGGPGALAVFDVSSGTAVQTALTIGILSFTDAAVTADGEDVAVASQGAHAVQLYRLPGLTLEDESYFTDDVPLSVAVAPDGSVAAGSWSYSSTPTVGLSVFGADDSTPRRTYPTPIDEGGLAWSADGSRLYAVSGGGSESGDTDPVLHVLDNPLAATTTIALNPPSAAEAGTPYTVGGELASAAGFAAGQTVHVTRTDAADPDGVALPDAAVNAAGTFSFTDTVTAAGDVSYQLGYDGDRYHQPAQGSTSLTVTRSARTDTTLWLRFEDRAKVGKKLKMQGRLTSALTIPTGATVTITRTDGTGPGPALVGTRKVAADGTFQITDVPFVAGPAVYTVSYAGDAAYNGTTVSSTVQVAP